MVQQIQMLQPVFGRWSLFCLAFWCSKSVVNCCCRKDGFLQKWRVKVSNIARVTHVSWPLSTKPEVHNILQCRQKRTEPRSPAICKKIWWRWVMRFWRYACVYDKHTDTSSSSSRKAATSVAGQYRTARFPIMGRVMHFNIGSESDVYDCLVV